jgi:7-carboxy-7-deazaguanine synthase
MGNQIVLASEAIFHTIQGEGKYIGYPTTFVRLSRCNLRCAWKNPDGSITKCDTPYTSFDPEIDKWDIDDLVAEIHKIGEKHICISGGEPYFQKELVTLVDKLKALDYFITLETNGTIYRESKADFISLSPKLSSSSAHQTFGSKHEAQRLKYEQLCQFVTNHNHQFKFVVNGQDDLDEIDDMIKEIKRRTNVDINDNIWLMPQGITTEQFDAKLSWMADVCKDRSWKLTDRMHIRIWGSRRGV